MSIAKEMNILEKYNNYEDIPPAVKAWVTIKAKNQGKNPIMVHAGIKAAMKKRSKK